MTTVLAIAPHPDDETLGCGGTLLRHRADGDTVHWLVASAMPADGPWPEERRQRREREITAVTAHYGFASVQRLDFPAARLDTVPAADLVAAMAAAMAPLQPETIYLPFRGDAHSDHAAVFDAAAACTKWFRYPSIRRVRVYETPSETGFGLGSDVFHPNLFSDITPHLDSKLAAMRLYEGEMGTFPFPRSEEAIRALAALRGSQCGRNAAEAFMSLREVI